jgi:hypothetical protein
LAGTGDDGADACAGGWGADRADSIDDAAAQTIATVKNAGRIIGGL